MLCAMRLPHAGPVTIANTTLGTEAISIDPSLLSAPTSTHSHLGAILGSAIGGGLGGLLLIGGLVVLLKARPSRPMRPSAMAEMGESLPITPVSPISPTAFLTASQQTRKSHQP